MSHFRFPSLTAVLLGLALMAANVFAETVLLDVRTPEEFAAGHIAGAVNIPYDQIGDRIGELAIDKDTEIGLYCGSGRRAGIAIDTLEKMGFTQLENLGGYKDLAAEREACAPDDC